jgi:hypothetical protein
VELSLTAGCWIKFCFVYLWMFLCGNIVIWATWIFYVAKFTILTPLLLLPWCGLSFPIVGLKISSLPNFALKSSNRIFIWYLGKWSKPRSNPSYKMSFESSLLSTVGECTFRTMTLHQRSLRTTFYILSLTNSTLLTADNILWCKKNLVTNWWFSFPFP